MLPTDTTPGDEPGDETTLPEAQDAVETETEETEDDSEDEVEDDAPVEDEPSEDGEPKKLSKSAKKNARIRAKIETLEEIARHESKRADEATARLKSLTDDVGPAPKREQFADDIEYGAALSAYEADKRITARTKKTTETTATEARDSANASKLNLFRERAMALTERYPDIEAKVFGDRTGLFDPTLAEIIMDTERGPEVAYFLASNREEASRIKSMQPLAQAREIGRIEATLTSTAPKPRTQSNAPPPPKILKGTKATAAVTDWDKQPIEKWLEHRNAQLAALNAPRRRA